jgi:hypothetical protein
LNASGRRGNPEILLQWAKPDWFEYLPMLLKSARFCSPWAYAPSFLLRDWKFDQHNVKALQKSFEAVCDILAESAKTLMETGHVRNPRPHSGLAMPV